VALPARICRVTSTLRLSCGKISAARTTSVRFVQTIREACPELVLAKSAFADLKQLNSTKHAKDSSLKHREIGELLGHV